MRWLCVFLILFSLSNAWSADWVYMVTEKSTESPWYIDKDTIQKDGKSALFWIKRNYMPPIEEEGATYVYTIAKVKINCDDSTMGLLSQYLYDDKGNNYPVGPKKLIDVIPGSVGAVLKDQACTYLGVR